MEKSWSKAKWRDVSEKSNVYEAGLLKLNCDKALFDLKWKPLNFQQTVKMTADWYKCYFEENDISMFKFSIDQIEEYAKLASSKSNNWGS